MNIIVAGSLAYDRIMDFPGNFSEHILPEKIHMLNVCFQVNSITEKFGGTAGNIAYALTLMGHKPLISAAIGHDYRRYFEWLKANGMTTDYIRVVEEEFTAGAYITTDKSDNQITGFNPGAMKYSSELDFESFDPKDTIVIFSPGNLNDMIDYPRVCKAKGIPYIFDPGQSLPMLESQDILEAVDGCQILICNDYELDLIKNKTGCSINDLLKRAENIIVTLGALGSKLYTRNEEIVIAPVSAREVLDPTGAGDSYRGGLISGLVEARPLEECARMGSVCASFAIECYGTQAYSFTQEEFKDRMC